MAATTSRVMPVEPGSGSESQALNATSWRTNDAFGGRSIERRKQNNGMDEREIALEEAVPNFRANECETCSGSHTLDIFRAVNWPCS
jgi:hypothetical protein